MNAQGKHTVTLDAIVRGLREGGLHAGCHVLLHSSLKSLGLVEGGAETVIDAFLEVLGPTGTLVAPTLTGDETLCAANPPVFDVHKSRCWTGAIPEALRLRPDAVRSWHPTHSAAAIGGLAKDLTRRHCDSTTPCDELSPYGLLAEREDAFIVLLGVDHESNTTLHHVEEMAASDYHMQAEPALATVRVGEIEMKRTVFLHRYGQARRFGAVEPLLLERGIQRNVEIGSATVRVVRTKPMVRLCLAALRANPRFLCSP